MRSLGREPRWIASLDARGFLHRRGEAPAVCDPRLVAVDCGPPGRQGKPDQISCRSQPGEPKLGLPRGNPLRAKGARRAAWLRRSSLGYVPRPSRDVLWPHGPNPSESAD